MRIVEEVIVSTNRKIGNPFNLLACIFVVSCALVGFKILDGTGLIAGVIIGIAIHMASRTFKGVKLWNTCERDYQYLITKGYQKREALQLISKSFNSDFSDEFHQKVTEKFQTLNEIVVFYTSVPENIKDEERVNWYLENTIVEMQPDGIYKANTQWK